MSTRRNGVTRRGSLLGLYPGEPLSSRDELVPISSDHNPSRDEKNIIHSYNRQTLAMEGARRKTLLALHGQEDIRNRSHQVFQDIVVETMESRSELKGTECEPYVAEFDHANLRDAARGILVTAATGERAIQL